MIKAEGALDDLLLRLTVSVPLAYGAYLFAVGGALPLREGGQTMSYYMLSALVWLGMAAVFALAAALLLTRKGGRVAWSALLVLGAVAGLVGLWDWLWNGWKLQPGFMLAAYLALLALWQVRCAGLGPNSPRAKARGRSATNSWE